MAEPTAEEQVNEVVAKATKDDKGKFVVSEDDLKDVSEGIALAVKAEIRHKNTQSAYTRSQQALSKSEKIQDSLVEQLADNITVKLTSEQQTELNVLKKSDPEAWRLKVNEYETTAKTGLEVKLKEIEDNAGTDSELDIRKEKLVAFTEATGIELNDDIIAAQLPASYSKDLADGTITFDEFLKSAETFITKAKAIAGAGSGNLEDNEVDLHGAGGRSGPSDAAKDGDIIETYKNTIF